MPVVDKDQWPGMGGFPAVVDSNSCGRNYGAVIIKHFHIFLKIWLQTINLSASSEMKALLVYGGCPLHLNIYLIKKLGGYGMVVLIIIKISYTIPTWRIW